MAPPDYFCCPHCKSVTEIDAGSVQPGQASHQETTDMRTSATAGIPKLRPVEHLKVLPYDVAVPRAAPTMVKSLPKRRSTKDRIKSLIFSLPENDSSEKRIHSQMKTTMPPKRPPRPPQELCPPVPSIHVTPLPRDTCRNPAKLSAHLSSRDSAFRLLLRKVSKRASPVFNKYALNPASVPSSSVPWETSSLAFPDDHPNLNSHLEHGARYILSETERLHTPGLVHHGSMSELDINPEHDISCSTLPTTASKVALRPSPLKPHRRRPAKPNAPASTIALSENVSTFKSSNCDITTWCEQEIESPHLSNISETSSHTTESFHSEKGTDSVLSLLETPPSSPVAIPQRNQSRRNKARHEAERYRNDLGIIDDVYDLFIDEDEKRRKHTANVFTEAQPETLSFQHTLDNSKRHVIPIGQSCLEQNDEYNTSDEGYFDVEPARAEAARALAGKASHYQSSDVDFENWVNSMNRSDPCSTRFEVNILEARDQQRVSPAVASDDLGQLKGRFSDFQMEDAQQVTSMNRRSVKKEVQSNREDGEVQRTSSRSESVPSEASIATHADSDLSWDKLRRHLRDLASTKDCLCDSCRGKQHSSMNSRSDLKLSAILSSECEQPPRNLQRIEIVWKGKQYPVLIDHHGKLWEAPCQNVDCRAHGRRKQDTSQNLF